MAPSCWLLDNAWHGIHYVGVLIAGTTVGTHTVTHNPVTGAP